MRIKKISSDKIVVQLTDTDLEYFDLDFDEHAPQAADLHKFLFEVMELVQTETGFDPYHGGQVVVEATTSPNGMSLIISKIHTDKKPITRETFSRIKNIKVKATSEKVGQKDMSALVNGMGMAQPKRKRRISKNTVFVFENFSDFESAVCVMTGTDFSDASLYREKERYALISSNFNEKECNIMSEYAIQTAKNDVVAYDIKEGWSPVVTDYELRDMVESLREMN